MAVRIGSGTPRIEIKNDRLLRLAHGRLRIFLLQPEAINPFHSHALIEWSRIILEPRPIDSDARIGGARVIAFGQLHERVMQAQRQRATIRRNTAHQSPGVV